MIEFRSAHVSNRLEATSLRLTEQRIGVIGANGSGKSTLARLINGLVEPDGGTVLVNGLDTKRYGPEVRRQVGFLFTDPGAQLVMPTVAEDVGLSLRRHHRDRTERAHATTAALDLVGVGDLAERSVHELSGGQRQLVALASVLAARPRIVVADEPTTLLDLRNTRLVAHLLFGLEQQLVLVTHDLELVEHCERVLVIDEGRVAFDGTPTEAVAHYRTIA